MSHAPSKQVSVSAVVPCHNEEAVVNELLTRLTAACEAAVGNDFEIVLVDDGSQDKTRALLRAAQAKDPRIVGVFLSHCHGHQLALTAGLSVARGERLFILDADLQDPPELLSPMMEKMNEGYDVVYGKRRSRKGESLFKQTSASVFYRLLSRLTKFDIPLDTGDFRLMTRRVADVLSDMPERDRFIRGMISWAGFPQAAFEYDRDARFAGETKYPLRKMLSFAVGAISSFSTIPLRIAMLIGFIFSALSFALIIYTLTVWLGGSAVEGWSSTMIAVLLIGGVQLMTIGVLGEYVGRTYMQTKMRPLFIVEEIIRAGNERVEPGEATHDLKITTN
ncbi:glycosyltransferase family 2 protein [Hoeflea prorocentri]|uniref:Glycosyltransferase family 2 protein n=1 Tax=Hoeflea prorocentri TaxID=1922333 RepID=A0A9X3UFW5_9HYPH|nr:glycosyltransferase family 2 protein [Hoeflea prorocentri]MCY6380002.1 glycosyltransferase family 2 protein [Hoeflea prorocentri]MDA5397802.1 glycosyltransferase family 2 protein [Hoeflea prorocentri]